MEARTSVRYGLSARVTQFDIPPVVDGLLIGKDSPIGLAAITKALDLLVADNFQTIELDDDTVGYLLVRRTITRRIPEEKLVSFAVERLKPLMCATEILHLELKAEVMIEDTDL
jgi:hypothetical protein